MKLITNAEYDAMEKLYPGLGERMFKLQEENKMLKLDVKTLQTVLMELCAEILFNEED
jgi:hypothetical protein